MRRSWGAVMVTKKQGRCTPAEESAPTKTAKQTPARKTTPKLAEESPAPKPAKRSPAPKKPAKSTAEPAPPKADKPAPVVVEHTTSADDTAAPKVAKQPAGRKDSPKSADDSPATKAPKRSQRGERTFRSIEELLAKVAQDQGLDDGDVTLNLDNMIVVEGEPTGWKAVAHYQVGTVIWTIRQQQSPQPSSISSSGSPSTARPTRRNPYNGIVFPGTDELLAHIAYHQALDEDEVTLGPDNRIYIKRQATAWRAVETATEYEEFWTVTEAGAEAQDNW